MRTFSSMRLTGGFPMFSRSGVQYCPACTQGPRGIAGHARLLVHRMGPVCMAFRCSDCDALWSRPTTLDSRREPDWSGPSTPAAFRDVMNGFALPQAYPKPPIF